MSSKLALTYSHYLSHIGMGVKLIVCSKCLWIIITTLHSGNTQAAKQYPPQTIPVKSCLERVCLMVSMVLKIAESAEGLVDWYIMAV